MKMRAPSYLELHKKGKLAAVKERLLKGLEHCELCPRNCKVNRLKGELGFCKTGRRAAISSFNLHFGEEPPLVGRGGSGTIFFTWCNLGCIYCQNYSISHSGEGSEIDTDKLASIMLYLQKEGAHNINFVTPSHVIAQIIEALIPAVEKGLRLPLVYNSGGYDKRAILKELEGIFDIYMPDAKYSDEHYSFKYSSSKDYWPVCKDALQEMHRQAGDLLMDASGIAERGLLIRHLVLPKRIAGSFEVLDFIANKISKDSYVNIMDQYYPCFKGHGIEELSRRVTPEEFEEVVEHAREVGLHRGF
jgi:putative pyruvate formate lyase activating enzyme